MSTTHDKPTFVSTDGKGTEVKITGPPSMKVGKEQLTNISEKQIDSALGQINKELEREKHYLSPQGKTIVKDAQALLDHARKQELLQKLYSFAQVTQSIEGPSASSVVKESSKMVFQNLTGQASLQNSVSDLASYIRASVFDYLTSSEYRDLTSDFYTILKSLAAEVKDERSSKKSQGKSKPREGTSQSVGQPLGAVGLDSLMQHIEAVGEHLMQQQFPSVGMEPSIQPIGAVGSIKQHTTGSVGLEVPIQPTESVGLVPPPMGEQVVEMTLPLPPMRTQIPTVIETVQRSGEHDKQEREKKRRQKLEDKQVNEINHRLNRFLDRVAEKKESKRMVKNFFEYSEQMCDALVEASESKEGSPEAQTIRALLDQSFEILADFAGKKLVDRYRKGLIKFFTDIKNDKELQAWRSKTLSFILDRLKNQNQDDEKSKKLIIKGRKILPKYRKDINSLYSDQTKIARKIRDDPELKEFQGRLNQLGTHLVCDENGEFDPLVMQQSISQVTKLLAGIFSRYLASIPIDKIQVYSPKYDLVMRKIKIAGTGFAPDRIEIGTRSHSSLALNRWQYSHSWLELSFAVENINPSIESFKYHVVKKNFPKFSDRGRASVSSVEDGLSVRVAVRISSQGGLERPVKAHLHSVDTHVGKLKIEVPESHGHSVLTPMLLPIVAKTLQSRLEGAIEQSIRSRFEDVVIQLNKWLRSRPGDRALKSTVEISKSLGTKLTSRHSEDKHKSEKAEEEPHKTEKPHQVY